MTGTQYIVLSAILLIAEVFFLSLVDLLKLKIILQILQQIKNGIHRTMGQAKSQFTDEELQDYEDLTFFTKKEILL